MALASRRPGDRRFGDLVTGIVVAVVLTTTAETLVAGPQASPAGALTLAAAQARALTSNPTIMAARLQRPVDEAGVGVAGERPNPDLAFDATRQTPRDALTLTVPFELGGKRGRRVALAQATVAAGEATLNQTIAQVLNDVRRAYFQVVAADARVALAEGAQALAQRARDAAQARLAAGEVPGSDVTQADLELADAEDDTTDAHGDAAASRADLNTLLGQPASTSIQLTDSLGAGPVPTLPEALAQATQVNSELAVLDRGIAAQAARLDVAKSLRIPDVSAGAGVTFNARPDFGTGWNITFDATLPLFASHQAGVTVETSELAHLRAERNARALAIAGEVEAAYARLSSARARLQQLQTRSLPLSVQVEQNAQSAYAAGEKGLTDLLQALQQVRDIRLKALQSSLDFELALADLEQAIGAPIR